MGITTAFEPGVVAALWPDHATWYAAYEQAAAELMSSGVVRADDAAEMVSAARSVTLAS